MIDNEDYTSEVVGNFIFLLSKSEFYNNLFVINRHTGEVLDHKEFDVDFGGWQETIEEYKLRINKNPYLGSNNKFNCPLCGSTMVLKTGFFSTNRVGRKFI